MTERNYKSIKRLLEKAYELLFNNDVISEKQEYAAIKIKMKSVLLKFERNYRPFTREEKWQ